MMPTQKDIGELLNGHVSAVEYGERVTDIFAQVSNADPAVKAALAKELAIGADVEQIRPLPDRHAIVNNYLHRGEAADLNALPEAEAGLAFFRCWARKEAVTKALGLGLSLPLDRYRVSCRPDMPPELLALEGDDQTSFSWSIIDIDPSPSSILTPLPPRTTRIWRPPGAT